MPMYLTGPIRLSSSSSGPDGLGSATLKWHDRSQLWQATSFGILTAGAWGKQRERVPLATRLQNRIVVYPITPLRHYPIQIICKIEVPAPNTSLLASRGPD